MSAALVEQAPAKINLTLRVLGRRADGYHDLESLVAFADVADTVTLQPGPELALDVSGMFAAASGSVAGNLVLKAATALRQHVPDLTTGHFHLEKRIPVAGGIGGGSTDAAAALRLLARANGLSLDDPRIASAALATGADVPVCLDPRPRVMRGIGERLTPPIDLPRFPAVLANPGVALATRDVFAGLSVLPRKSNDVPEVPREPAALLDYLKGQGNDLSAAAIARAPAVAEVLDALRQASGVRFAAMSGSGSTCFALFASQTEAVASARGLQSMRKEWWVHAGSIGAQP